MTIRNLPSDILQFGLAFVFFYAAVQIILNPQSFVGYTPDFVFSYIPVNLFMYSFAISEIALGLWIISGKKLVISSLYAAALIGVIILVNLELFIVLFRNIAIMCGALALAAMNYKKSAHINITIDTQPEENQEHSNDESKKIEVQNPSAPTNLPAAPSTLSSVPPSVPASSSSLSAQESVQSSTNLPN